MWHDHTFRRENKFRYNFQASLDPFCNCGRHIEITIHFFLHCSNYSNQRKTLFEKISNIKRSLLNQNDSIIVETLLFASTGLNDEENACIIESTIEYITTTERFITPLLWIRLSKSPLFLKSLIDFGSPYVKLFSCLVVQYFCRRSGGEGGWKKVLKIGSKQYRDGLHKIGGLGTLCQLWYFW